MSRTVGADGAKTAAAIRAAGLQLIFDHGFEAMSLRRLATAVGVQPASLYNHIATKQDLLFQIIVAQMRELIETMRGTLGDDTLPATERLRRFITHHLRALLSRRREAAIVTSELRALTPNDREAIVALRVAYEALLIAILDAGVAEGTMGMPDTRIAAYAVIGMLNGAGIWYRPGGRLGQADIIELHVGLVLNGITGNRVPGTP